jgi:hypothetical protein
VNTAQASMDSAKATLDAANAQLQADQTNKVIANLNADAVAVGQAQAKLQDAQQVLDRVRNTVQAVSITAAAGSPITTTAPATGTAGFGVQTWLAPTVYTLPEGHGAVLYHIEEGVMPGSAPQPYYVRLVASILNGQTQPDFKTVMTALGPPTLGPQNASFTNTGGDALFLFTRPVVSLLSSSVLGAADKKPAPGDMKGALTADRAHVRVEVKSLTPGQYILQVSYTYDMGDVGTAEIAFSVNK